MDQSELKRLEAEIRNQVGAARRAGRPFGVMVFGEELETTRGRLLTWLTRGMGLAYSAHTEDGDGTAGACHAFRAAANKCGAFAFTRVGSCEGGWAGLAWLANQTQTRARELFPVVVHATPELMEAVKAYRAVSA